MPPEPEKLSPPNQSGKLSPEYRRAYRARCIAEGRCANCARVRECSDTQSLTCASCRAVKNAGSARRYADQRADAPPYFDRGDPRESFRYGKNHLVNPRRITAVLDKDTHELLRALRRHYPSSPHYEPYQRSNMVRRILRYIQPRADEATPRGDLHRSESSTVSLCFMCDEENYQTLKRQMRRTHCSQSAALRDVLYFACYVLIYQTPHQETIRLLWHPNPDSLPEPPDQSSGSISTAPP